MKAKSITIFVVVVLALSLAMIPGVVASEHNQTAENETGSVDVGVGQSLSVAVDGVSTEVENQVSDIARERALGEASSESERAQVLAEDLNETSRQAREVNDKYQEVVKNYKNDEMSHSELITEVSRLSNEADQIEEDLNSIQYASQFIPEEELNRTGVDTEKIDGARKEVGVVGGNVAKVARDTALNPNSKMSLEANESGIEVAVEKSNGRAYNGVDKDEPEHGVFNISADEALQALAEEYNFNASEYEVSVEKDDDGYYEVEAENETVEYEASIDGRDGSISSFERDVDEGPSENVPGREDGERGPPEDVPREDGDDDERQGPPEDVPRGPPDWAENDAELEIDTEGEIQPNSTVNLTVTDDDGNVVVEANISVNGGNVGQTDADGMITVQIPDDKEVEIKAEKGDSEGELEYEQEEDEQEEDEQEEDEQEEDEQEEDKQEEDKQEEDKQEENLRIEVQDRNNQSAKLAVLGESNSSVENAEVRVNDELIGETDSNGMISIEIPESEDVEIVAQKNGEEAEYEIENDENQDNEEPDTEEDESDEEREDADGENQSRGNGR